MTRLLLLLAACGSSSSEPPPKAAPPPPPTPVVEGKLTSSAGLVGNTYQVRASGTKIDATTLPITAFLGGLPLVGKVDLDVSIDVGNGNADLAWGHVNVGCNGCKLGDDVAKLQLVSKSARMAAFAGDGLKFGHIAVDTFAMKATLNNGVGKIDSWQWQSPDLDLQVSGTVQLARDPQQSVVHGCLRFKPSAALAKQQPATYAVIQTTGAPVADDGYFTIALEGTIGEMKRLGRSCP